MSTPTYLEVNISQLQNLDISGNTTIVGNTTMGGNISLTGNTTSNSNIKVINNSSSTVLGIQNAAANQYCNLSLSGISYTGNLNPKSVTAIVGMTSVGGDYSVLQDELSYLSGVVSPIQTQINSLSNTVQTQYAPLNNPTFTGTVSGVSKSMVGLGNVDNTSDANKPVSTATQTALNLKANDNAVVHLAGTETITGAKTFSSDLTANGRIISSWLDASLNVKAIDNTVVHLAGTETISGNKTFTGTVSGLTSTTVGLGNVNNTSDADKPISTATQTALNLKANDNAVVHLAGTETITGNKTFTGTISGLSKTTVGLENVDNTSDANKPISTATQTALSLRAFDASCVHITGNETIAGNKTFTGTIAGISKTMVGLGNVDDTSDLNKPISTATQTALNLKAPINNATFTGTTTIPSALFTGDASFNGNLLAEQITSSWLNSQLASKQSTGNYVTTDTNQNISSLKSVDPSSNYGIRFLSENAGELARLAFGLQNPSLPLTGTGAVISGTLWLQSSGSLKSRHNPTAGEDLTRKAYVDGTFVSLGGVQTITAVKTFNADASFNANILANRIVSPWLDTSLNAKAFDNTVVHLAGSETITGSKVFSADTQYNSNINLTGRINSSWLDTSLNLRAFDASCVHLAGTETISGDKTFSGACQVATLGCSNIRFTGSSVQTGNGIYFPASNLYRKLVLYPVTANEYGNYSIGVNNTNLETVFMVPDNTRSYKFSYGTSTTTKSEYVTINNSGILINGNIQNAWLDASLNLRALDTTVVHLAGTETVSGAKTFSSDTAFSGRIISSWLDVSLNRRALDTTVVHNTGTETIAGDKTFTGTISGISKTMVGLSNVDNTSDANKPVSTATQTALDLKANDSDVVHLGGTETIVGDKTFTGIVYGISSAMVGLGNVENTYDMDKPVSIATQTALDLKANDNAVVHLAGTETITGDKTFSGTVSGLTKSTVGLSNVDNTSDANKPISTATQTALNAKANDNEVVKTTGNQSIAGNKTFTGTIAGISATMIGLGNVNNTSDANKPVSIATQTALDTKAPLNNPTFTGTVSGISKTMVGLGNVDNTSDANKPVSTATQTALNLRAFDASCVHLTGNETIQGLKTFTSSVKIGSGGYTPPTDCLFIGQHNSYRKIILHSIIDNEFQNYSIGTNVTNEEMVFMIPGITRTFKFCNASGSTSKNDLFTLGLNSGATLTVPLTVPSIISSWLDASLNRRAFDASCVYLTGNQSISGIKTFTDNVVLNRSVGFSTTPIDTDGAIYFPTTTNVNRKVVLYRTANNDFQNHSIGTQSNTMQFMVDGNTSTKNYQFSGAASSSSKTDFVKISSDGLNIQSGNLIVNVSGTETTIPSKKLSYLNDFTDTQSIKQYVDETTGSLSGTATTELSLTTYKSVPTTILITVNDIAISNIISSNQLYVYGAQEGLFLARSVAGVMEKSPVKMTTGITINAVYACAMSKDATKLIIVIGDGSNNTIYWGNPSALLTSPTSSISFTALDSTNRVYRNIAISGDGTCVVASDITGLYFSTYSSGTNSFSVLSYVNGTMNTSCSGVALSYNGYTLTYISNQVAYWTVWNNVTSSFNTGIPIYGQLNTDTRSDILVDVSAAVFVGNVKMTSNTTTITNAPVSYRNGTYYATASSGYIDVNDLTKAYLAFDFTGEVWHSAADQPNNAKGYASGVYSLNGQTITTNIYNTSDVAGEYIEITLPYRIILRRVEQTAANNPYDGARMPKSIVILGSNDNGASWNVIFSRVNGTQPTFSTYNNKETIHIPNPPTVPYSKIRLIARSLYESNCINLMELNYFGDIYVSPTSGLDLTGKMSFLGTSNTVVYTPSDGKTQFIDLSQNEYNQWSSVVVRNSTVSSYNDDAIKTANLFTSNVLDLTGQAQSFRNGTYIVSTSTDAKWSDITSAAFYAFNRVTSGSNIWHSSSNYNGDYTGNVITTNIASSSSIKGDWIQIQYPFRLLLKTIELYAWNNSDYVNRLPNSMVVVGSNDGFNWNIVYSQTARTTTYSQTDKNTIQVSGANTPYSYYRLIVRSVAVGYTTVNILQLNYVGDIYENASTDIVGSINNIQSNSISNSFASLSYGLICYYPFDTDVYNYVNGYRKDDLVLGTATTINIAYGNTKLSTGSLSFNGTTSYALLPTIRFTPQGITIACWVKSNTATPANLTRIFDFGTSTTSVFALCFGTGGVIVYGVNGTTYTSSSYTMDTNWHHYCLVISSPSIGSNGSSTTTIYVDGVSKYSAAIPYPSLTTPEYSQCYIGVATPNNNSLRLNGYINQFVIYNREFSATDIPSLFGAVGASAFPIPTTHYFRAMTTDLSNNVYVSMYGKTNLLQSTATNVLSNTLDVSLNKITAKPIQMLPGILDTYSNTYANFKDTNGDDLCYLQNQPTGNTSRLTWNYPSTACNMAWTTITPVFTQINNTYSGISNGASSTVPTANLFFLAISDTTQNTALALTGIYLSNSNNGIYGSTIINGIWGAWYQLSITYDVAPSSNSSFQAGSISRDKTKFVVSIGQYNDTNTTYSSSWNQYLYWGNVSSVSSTSTSITLNRIQQTAGGSYYNTSMTADGNRVVICGQNGVYFTDWNGSNYNVPTRISFNLKMYYWRACVSADGNRIAFTGSNNSVFMTYWASWNGTNYSDTTYIGNINGLGRLFSFTGDKNNVLVSCSNNTISCYSVWNGTNYSPFVNISSSIIPTDLDPWGSCIDNTGNIYIQKWNDPTRTFFYKIKITYTNADLLSISNNTYNVNMPTNINANISCNNAITTAGLMYETTNAVGGTANAYTINYSTGGVFYIPSTIAITANASLVLTNIPTTTTQSFTLSIVYNQASTRYYINQMRVSDNAATPVYILGTSSTFGTPLFNGGTPSFTTTTACVMIQQITIFSIGSTRYVLSSVSSFE